MILEIRDIHEMSDIRVLQIVMVQLLILVLIDCRDIGAEPVILVDAPEKVPWPQRGIH